MKICDGRYMRILFGAILSAMFLVHTAQSQVHIYIQSNDPDAAVYADSLYLGQVHDSPYVVDHTTRLIRLTTPRAAAWSVPPIQTSLQANPGERVDIVLNFPRYHRIESNPFGAKAWFQDDSDRRFLGLTPVVFSTMSTEGGKFYIELDGYTSAVIEPKAELWNRYEVSFTSQVMSIESLGVKARIPNSRRWIEWSAAVVAVAAGAVAVHYKFRADRINDEYRATGDASLRPRVAELDDYSAIALGVMQAGLVTLAIRFALK